MGGDPTSDNFILGIIQAGGSGGSSGPATQIIETGGPTTLTIGAIADGQYAKRVGTTLVGGSPAGAGTVTSVDVAVPAHLTSSGGPITGAGTITIGLSGTALPVLNGGTGGTTAAAARTALGTAASGANSDITSITGLSTPLTVGQGGTGAATAGGALTNLGAAGVASANAFTGANTFGTSVIPITITPGAATAVSPPTHLQYTGPADTNLTNGAVGVPDIVFDLSAIKQWGGNTTVSNYKAIQIKAPVLSSTTATTAFTTAATVCIEGPPTAGTNATASGSIAMLINAGNLTLNAGTLTLKGTPANVNITQSNASSGVSQSFLLTGGSLTNQTASTETTDVSFALARTVQHAQGALTTQRAFVISAPTYGFATGASTVTDTATFAVSGPPVAGTNATFTNQPSAIWAQAGQIRTDGNFMASAAAAPTTLQDGQFWSDSTQKTMSIRLQSTTQTSVTCLFTATADATVANTAAETSILGTGVGTKTLPANFLVAGKTIRGKVRGILSDTLTPTINIKVKLGATVIMQTTAVALITGLANAGFDLGFDMTCRTTGASGTVMGGAMFFYANGTTAQVLAGAGTAAVTVDTTSSQVIDVSVTWGTASASNTITGQTVTLEVVN